MIPVAGHAPLDKAAPRRMPMRRIVLILSLSLCLSLCLIVSAVLILNARIAVEEETGSAYRLARDTVQRRIPPAFDSRDAMDLAGNLAAEIDGLRHVSAVLIDSAGRSVPLPPHDTGSGDREAPDWFAALMRPVSRQDSFAITSYPNVLGRLVLSSDPGDEIDEVWEDFAVILPILFLTGLGMVALSMVLTEAIRRRLALVQDAMGHMQRGDLEVRAPDSRLSELDDLAAGVNALASHLQEQRAENEMLQARLVGLSEGERSRIAHDLHDEMGPQLFALRAAVDQAQLAARALTGPDVAAVAEALSAIADYTGAVQRSARAAINDLRPMLVGEGTLSEILHELAAGVGDIAPGVRVVLDIDPQAGQARPGELAELSIYRFVRESVVNAMRHGNARMIRVSLRFRDAPERQIVARVADDGRGPQPGGGGPKFGQIGMQDRARALGAEYLPPWREDNLTVTELRMPHR